MTDKKTSLHFVATAFYALLAFITLHAIIFHNGTHAAGYDYFNYNWNFWWIRHALTTPGLSVYESNFVFYPITSNLGYHALTAFWFPVWAILEPLVGTLTAINVIIFIGCFLNGYLLFVLLRSEGVAPSLALLGGAALQVAPLVRYFYYNTHLNLMDWFWIPAHLLLWKQIFLALENGKLRLALLWAMIQGVGIWGLGLTDLQFPIFVGFLLVPYGVWTLWQSQKRGQLIFAGIIVLMVALPLLWFAGPLPYMRQFSGTLIPGPAEDRPGIPFPGGYLSTYKVWWWWNTPTLGANVVLMVLAALVVSLFWKPHPPTPSPNSRRGRNVFSIAPSLCTGRAGVGFPALHRGLRGGVWGLRPSRWFWFVFMIPPLLLSMGATITLFGVHIPMPYRIMHTLTGGMFRMPWRLAPIYIIAAMLFVGKTWTPLLPKMGKARPLIFAAIFVLIGLDVRVYETAPLEKVLPNYAFYDTMRQEPYPDYVIIDAPTGRGTGEALLGNPQAIQFQYYGIRHQRRIVNGFISRAPLEETYPILVDDPLLSWLGQRRLLDPALVEPQLRDIIFNWPVGYIVIHEDFIERNAPTLQEIYGYFNSLPDLLCPVFIEPGAVAYRTAWHPDGCPARIPPEIEPDVYQIDIGTRGDERYIGWGWHWPESVAGLTLRWTGEYPQTRLYFDLPPGDYELTLSVQAFWEGQQVRLLVNEVPLGEMQPVAPDNLQTLTFALPADVVGDGQHLTLTLDYDGWIVPAEVGQSADPRKLAIAVDWVRFQQMR